MTVPRSRMGKALTEWKPAAAQVKAEFWRIFDDIDAAPGTAAQAVARNRARSFTSKWRKLYPAAIECLEDDFAHLITYLRFPVEHWDRVRHSNFIERTFGDYADDRIMWTAASVDCIRPGRDAAPGGQFGIIRAV